MPGPVCLGMTTHVLADGLAMGESPRWHDGVLWLCDWLAGEVLTIDAQGRTDIVRRIEGLPFSVDWLPDGREVYTTHRRRGRRSRTWRRTAGPAGRGTRSWSTPSAAPS